MINLKPPLLCKFILINVCFIHTPSLQASQFELGYAQCVVDDVFDGDKVELTIEGSCLFIRVYGPPLSPEQTHHAIERIKKNKQIKKVVIQYEEKPAAPFKKQEPSEETATDTNLQVRTEPKSEFLPQTPLYSTPIADPRWPKFKVGYQLHEKNKFGKNIFSLAFGENVPLYQYTSNTFAAEAGVQAGLFGLMDISHNPTTLINSDYFVGFGITIEHWRKWHNLLQFSHTSSHIGDELLIKNRSLIKERINLSYEQFRWLSGYKIMDYRPFAGVAYLVHKDPSSVKPFSFEYGADYLSPKKYFDDMARFFSGVHVYHWQETNYTPSFSAAIGLQLENQLWDSRKLRLLIEYSNGHSREGQFYKYKQQYIGTALVLSY